MLSAFGYRFAARYIRRDKHVNDKPDTSGDWLISLSREELFDLTNICDMAVTPVQIGRLTFDRNEGKRIGEAAAYNVEQLGFPKGCVVWLDAEWRSAPLPDDAAYYINSWSEPVIAAGYEPGLYIGPNIGMSADQLYFDLAIRHYWKSASYVPFPSNRGCQMIQGTPLNVMGLSLDQDLVCIDSRGERFRWAVK
jgi:hypothetical protein